jgi:hypothetical protein
MVQGFFFLTVTPVSVLVLVEALALERPAFTLAEPLVFVLVEDWAEPPFMPVLALLPEPTSTLPPALRPAFALVLPCVLLFSVELTAPRPACAPAAVVDPTWPSVRPMALPAFTEEVLEAAAFAFFDFWVAAAEASVAELRSPFTPLRRPPVALPCELVLPLTEPERCPALPAAPVVLRTTPPRPTCALTVILMPTSVMTVTKRILVYFMISSLEDQFRWVLKQPPCQSRLKSVSGWFKKSYIVTDSGTTMKKLPANSRKLPRKKE